MFNKNIFISSAVLLLAACGSSGNSPELSVASTSDKKPGSMKKPVAMPTEGWMVTDVENKGARYDNLLHSNDPLTLVIKTVDGSKTIRLESASNQQILSDENNIKVAYTHNAFKNGASIYLLGVPTLEQNMPDRGMANYRGDAWAIGSDKNNRAVIENGKVALAVDFGKRSITGSLDFRQSNRLIETPFAANIYGNTFSTNKPLENVNVYGKFLGEKANAVAGHFSISEQRKKGVFKATSVKAE